jgi:hypothetical protein
MENDVTEEIKLELNCRLEEYRALRTEIVSTLTSAYQTTNLTLITIGVLFSGAKFASDFIGNNPTSLLSITMVFHVLLWTQLRYEYAVLNMSNHIINTVTPAIRELLKGTSFRYNLNTVLSWESSGRENNHSNKYILFYPIEGARYLLPLLFAILTFFAYILISDAKDQLGCPANIFLSILNLILIFYSAWMIFEVRKMLRG